MSVLKKIYDYSKGEGFLTEWTEDEKILTVTIGDGDAFRLFFYSPTDNVGSVTYEFPFCVDAIDSEFVISGINALNTSSKIGKFFLSAQTQTVRFSASVYYNDGDESRCAEYLFLLACSVIDKIGAPLFNLVTKEIDLDEFIKEVQDA